MTKGWIKLDRQMTEHWLWKDKPFSYAQAWVDLLLHANHKPAKILIKNCLVELKRGDQARSERTLEKDWGWSRGKVRRFLVLLKNDGMIVQRAVPVTSIISICNYESFQGDSTTGSTSSSTSVDTTGEPQAVHKQECKNENNDKNTTEKPSAVRVPYQKILDEYHSLLPELSSVQIYTDARKAKVKKVYMADKSHQADDYYQRYFNYVKQSPFLMGQTDKPFNCNFEWLMNINNMAKVVEGNYHGN